MKTCLKCDRKVLAKGLCGRHYYEQKRKSTDPKDIAIYQDKPRALAAKKWKSKTNVDKEKYNKRQKIYADKLRMELLKYVLDRRALASFSPCRNVNSVLHRDHEHGCDCGKRLAGCEKCFRGLLCAYHNKIVIPLFENMYDQKAVPNAIREYLIGRPLLGTGLILTNRG
jgi:hypothetical protein